MTRLCVCLVRGGWHVYVLHADTTGNRIVEEARYAAAETPRAQRWLDSRRVEIARAQEASR